jgi:two-component system, chemotaxis family, sensor kinase CheA
MTEHLDVQEFLQGYLAEAQEHLASAGSNLLAAEEALRRGEPHPRAVRELFRALHTLKGLSAMIGAEPIADVAHEMEAVLRSADRAGGRLPAESTDLLADGLRAIEARVATLGAGEPIPPAPPQLLEALVALQPAGGEGPRRAPLALPRELIAKLSAADREQLAGGIAAGRRARRIDFLPSPERAARGISITSVRERVGAVAEIVKVLPRAATPEEGAPAGLAFVLLVLAGAPDAQLAEAADVDLSKVTAIGDATPAEELAGAASEPDPIDEAAEGADLSRGVYVRVEVARLDEALEHLSALVVSRARLDGAVATLAAIGADVRVLAGALQEHGRQLRSLRTAVMRARLIRVSELLDRAPLVVRGSARATGKRVRLVVEAGEAEVDKAVGERLFPAIIHLLRNAVDHAIEHPADRVRAGKPEDGVIRVTCRDFSDNQLELVIADDGRGVDAEAIAHKAGAPVPRTPAELLELISRPGFSTAERVTQTSGRGVGMDIVRRIVMDELGGDLRVETRRGAGTTFTLRVPLSLTIVDALTFECGTERFVVPVSAVEALIEVDASEVVEAPRPARGGAASAVRMLRRHAETLPLVRLDAVLGLGGSAPAHPKAIVIRRDGAPFAFEVDRMLGQQEVVIRPVADPLVQVEGVSGSTDLGDGRPTLVLDLVSLARSLGGARAEVP